MIHIQIHLIIYDCPWPSVALHCDLKHHSFISKQQNYNSAAVWLCLYFSDASYEQDLMRVPDLVWKSFEIKAQCVRPHT